MILEPRPVVSNRYNPEPGRPYGRCSTCGTDLETREDSDRHLHDTYEESRTPRRSHSVHVLNPDRSRRLERRIDDLIDDALDDIVGFDPDETYIIDDLEPDEREELVEIVLPRLADEVGAGDMLIGEITAAVATGDRSVLSEAWNDLLEAEDRDPDTGLVRVYGGDDQPALTDLIA